MSEIKLCKNCDWYVESEYKYCSPKCSHPSSLKNDKFKVLEIDVVTGKKIAQKDKYDDYYYCSTQRKHRCGTQAIYFEAGYFEAGEIKQIQKNIFKKKKIMPKNAIEELVDFIAQDDAKTYDYTKNQSKPKSETKELEPPDIDNDDDNFASLEIEEG